MEDLEQLCLSAQEIVDAPEFDVIKFEELLEKIHASGDPDAIKHLLPVFRDDFSFPEVMFSIIHLIESFDRKTYIQYLVTALASSKTLSDEWTDVLLVRVLNSQEYSEELVNFLNSINSDSANHIKTRILRIEKQEGRTEKVVQLRQRFPELNLEDLH